MTQLRMTITPWHDHVLAYPSEYIHQVDLVDGEYTTEELGEAMLKALELAHTHPEGPTWFHHFTVHFEVGDPDSLPFMGIERV